MAAAVTDYFVCWLCLILREPQSIQVTQVTQDSHKPKCLIKQHVIFLPRSDSEMQYGNYPLQTYLIPPQTTTWLNKDKIFAWELDSWCRLEWRIRKKVIYDILFKKFTHFSFQPPFLLFQKLWVSSTPTGPCIWQHLLKCQHKTHLPLSKNIQ